MGEELPPHPPRVDSGDSALAQHVVVRNLDTGEARPLAAGTGWTADRRAAPPAPRTRRKVARTRSEALADVSLSAADGALRATMEERKPVPGMPTRVVAHKKTRTEFRGLRRYQRFSAHDGPVRALACSPSGLYLASAGSDALVAVWFVAAHLATLAGAHSPVMSPPQSPGVPAAPPVRSESGGTSGTSGEIEEQDELPLQGENEKEADGTPFATFSGHKMDVVDLSWSKNDFLLTASMDRTMKLWHPSTPGCLWTAPHPDYVTSVSFHPQDEQICVSGTADGVLRLWHLRERTVLSEVESDEVITATAISPGGKVLLAGTICGRCKFYDLFDEIQGEWQLIHTTQMDVRSTRGKNKKGAKICGITFREDNPSGVLISSSHSRIRLYSMDDKSILEKFTGHSVASSHLSACFSPCGNFILSGSENRSVYMWRVDDDEGGPVEDPGGGGRRDRSVCYETFIPHDHDAVSAATFGKSLYHPRRRPDEMQPGESAASGLLIFTASEQGEIAVFSCL